MKKSLLYILLLFAAVAFVGCVDESDKVSVASSSSFASLYPNKKVDNWAFCKGYEVAYFKDRKSGVAVWFDSKGWVMSITDCEYSDLPSIVKSAFESDGYSDWEKNRTAKLERKGRETVYLVNVERNKVIYDLFFNSTGILVKKADETNSKRGDEKYIPHAVPAIIAGQITKKYPNSIIYDIDVMKNVEEVSFTDGGIAKKAMLLTDGTWIMTTYRIDNDSIPKETRSAVLKEMPGYDIIEATLTETRTGRYYTIECEHGNITQTLYINSKGKIVEQ